MERFGHLGSSLISSNFLTLRQSSGLSGVALPSFSALSHLRKLAVFPFSLNGNGVQPRFEIKKCTYFATSILN